MAEEFDSESIDAVISDPSKGYFAAKPTKECIQSLEDKIQGYYDTLTRMGWWDKLRDMYSAWHGAYNTSVSDAHQLSFSGDDGEYTELVANHLRNIGRHMHTMVTSVRPAMETRAINTDYKSQVQTKLANGLLDYYMRASGKKVEERLKLATEYAIALGGGFIKLAWNPNAGEMTNGDQIMEMVKRRKLGEQVKIPFPEYQGDIDFSLHSPFDIIEDLAREDVKQDWRIVRSSKNKYDLMKVHPEFATELEKLKSISEYPNLTCLYSSNFNSTKATDDVPIWEFYHERTEAMPEGRYILFCNSETPLYDGPLPYRTIPVYSIKPARVLGTPLGYTDLFDLMPLQDAINTLYSTVITNQAAFGVQTILNPSTSNIDASQINNGLAVLNYNPQGGKPEALQLTSTPKEVFDFMGFLIQTAETISGINSVVRGQPEANLRSGSAIAMIQSNAIQYMSNLQAEYVHLIEDVGMGIVQMLVDFADSPRIADIVGESGKAYVKTFKGDDLRSINRVIVDSSNPMSKTIAGRINMADNLLQYGEITPKQYMNIVNTGNLETGTDNSVNEEMGIKKENEAMMEGVKPIAFFLDLHSEHITGHRALISDPDLRQNPELVQIVTQHIQEHIDLLKNTDPQILMTFGQQPLQGMQPPMGGEGSGVQPSPATQPPVEQAMAQNNAEPQQPNATLPQGFESSPVTPEQNLQRIQGQ